VGAPNLSQVELLAILVGGSRQIEAAQLLTQRFGTDLPHALTDELTAIPGVGESTAARILAAVELGKRFASVSSADRPQIKSPSDAHTLLLPLIGDAERECFVVLYLNTRNQVTEHEILYRGTLNTSLVNTGEVFRGAIRRHCAAIIVGHNHPSGDPSPSPEDVALTKRLVDAGKLLDVELLDHLVVARGRYVSLRERGLGFSA
jgi:DNA repair protein RadC